MLSDEEKEVVEWLRQSINEYNDIFQGKIEDESGIKRMKTIKNLIKKQSKEIEEYKNQLDLDYVKNNYTSNDKIKAKIEEYDDKGMTVNLANRSAGKTFQQAVHYEVKKVLQSLLEKE